MWLAMKPGRIPPKIEAALQVSCQQICLGRIIHKPTFLQEMQEYYLQVGQDNGVEKRPTAAFEALLFVVLFGAFTSLSEPQHWDPSPPGRDTAPGQLKQGCLQALRSLSNRVWSDLSSLKDLTSTQSRLAVCFWYENPYSQSSQALSACTDAQSYFSCHV